MRQSGRTDSDAPAQLGCWGQAAVVALFLAIFVLATL
jgi:hypothetical protein